jgi:alkylation response protein AidB-like acyl-CoA dehydrogenase
VDFTFTEEQDEFRDTVRRFLSDYSSERRVRQLMVTESGFDPDVWAIMSTDLGLQGLIIPEEFGGAGATWQELGIVLEEMGRVLYCGPYFATVVLATSVIVESGDSRAQKAVLPSIADGSTLATLTLAERTGKWDEKGIATRAWKSDGQFRINGVKRFVIDGAIADLVVVPALTTEGLSLFCVNGDAPGLTKTNLPPLDLTRKMAELEFDGVPAELMGPLGQGGEILERVLDLAAIGMAAEQVGGAQSALDMAVEYAKERIQFGQPIGSFQAIKHKCADVLLDVESARSALYYALHAASEKTEDLPAVASLVKAFCSDAFVLAAHENIQIHGGIGFTWEVPAHLYFKRAKSTELYLGDPIYHRERFAQRIGL